MVRVRALQKCFIGNCLREPGVEFEHDGPISRGVLVPVEDMEPTKLPRKPKAKKPEPSDQTDD
jgi:hypothetical protein